MLTVCPNCLGERHVDGEAIGSDAETGEPIVSAETCRVCDGRGGFGEANDRQREIAAE